MVILPVFVPIAWFQLHVLIAMNFHLHMLYASCTQMAFKSIIQGKTRNLDSTTYTYTTVSPLFWEEGDAI